MNVEDSYLKADRPSKSKPGHEANAAVRGLVLFAAALVAVVNPGRWRSLALVMTGFSREEARTASRWRLLDSRMTPADYPSPAAPGQPDCRARQTEGRRSSAG